MRRFLSAALVAASLVTLAYAQDGPLRGRARPWTTPGRTSATAWNPKSHVGKSVLRNGKFSAASRAGSNGTSGSWAPRSSSRPERAGQWSFEVRFLTIRQAQAVELVVNTLGVTTVVDQLAVVKEVKVIKPQPDVGVIESPRGHHRNEGHCPGQNPGHR